MAFNNDLTDFDARIVYCSNVLLFSAQCSVFGIWLSHCHFPSIQFLLTGTRTVCTMSVCFVLFERHHLILSHFAGSSFFSFELFHFLALFTISTMYTQSKLSWNLIVYIYFSFRFSSHRTKRKNTATPNRRDIYNSKMEIQFTFRTLQYI